MRNIAMAKKKATKKKSTRKKATTKSVKYQLKKGVDLKPGFTGWGGYRPGAGRKKSADSGVSHTSREQLKKGGRALITLRILKGRPKLTSRDVSKLLKDVFTRAGKDYFEILQYRIHERGIFLLVTAKDRPSLGRGMGGLGSRMSRQLNRLWGTSGTVYADRYEDKVLHTPAEVRKAMRGVGGGGTWKKLS